MFDAISELYFLFNHLNHWLAFGSTMPYNFTPLLSEKVDGPFTLFEKHVTFPR